MGEDNKNLKELHIIDGATGKEIPLTPIKEIEFCEKEGEFEENLDEWFKASREASIELEIQSIKNIQQMQKLFAKVDKAYLKILSPITKKRARKLLMSQGYDRNSVNSIISRMKNRNLKNLWEYFYL
jgi:hypothetical protein